MEPHRSPGLTEPRLVRWLLTALAGAFMLLFLLLPLGVVFTQALGEGLGEFAAAVSEPYALAAVRLTLVVASITVAANVLFGLAAAWAIARYEFRGKRLLVTLIDLPFSVSPVISGLLFVLLFGAHGLLGGFLLAHGVKIVFAVPGLVLATIFVTSPLVVRELIPLMQAQGQDEEEAAMTLGAGGWRTFFLVSLPKIKWGLFYGVVLCSARAVGEFGAVSVVSGHIRGQTTTVPLHVEMLYNEYQFTAAFAVATLLAVVALLSLVLKGFIEWRSGLRGGAGPPPQPV